MIKTKYVSVLYLASLFQVALVSDEDNGNIMITSDPIDQLPVREDLVKTAMIGYRVADDKPFPLPHVLFTHSGELRLENKYIQQNKWTVCYA